MTSPQPKRRKPALPVWLRPRHAIAYVHLSGVVTLNYTIDKWDGDMFSFPVRIVPIVPKKPRRKPK